MFCNDRIGPAFLAAPAKPGGFLDSDSHPGVADDEQVIARRARRLRAQRNRQTIGGQDEVSSLLGWPAFRGLRS